MNCPTSSWTVSVSESILSTDGSKIGNFFSYGNSRKLYIAEFDASSGAVIGTTIKII